MFAAVGFGRVNLGNVGEARDRWLAGQVLPVSLPWMEWILLLNFDNNIPNLFHVYFLFYEMCVSETLYKCNHFGIQCYLYLSISAINFKYSQRDLLQIIT